MFGKFLFIIVINIFFFLPGYAQDFFYSGQVYYKAKRVRVGIDPVGQLVSEVGLCPNAVVRTPNCGSPKNVTNEMLSEPFLKELRKNANKQYGRTDVHSLSELAKTKVSKLSPLMIVITTRYAISLEITGTGFYHDPARVTGKTNMDDDPKYIGIQMEGGWGGVGEQNPLRLIQLLLDNGADPNLKDDRGWTALMWASFVGYGRAAKLLVERGADLYATANDGSSALTLASLAFNSNGNHQSVIGLMKTQANKELLPWLEAAKTGDVAKAEQILGSGLLKKIHDCFKEDYSNVTLVDIAVANTSAISEAISNDRNEMVKFLLDKGAKPDGVTAGGDSLLIRAASKGNLAIAQSLIEKGANVNHESSSHTALGAAIENNRKEMVKFLIEKGASVSASNKDGDSLLIQAASKGNLAIVQLLIEKGANVNHESSFHHTALTMASEKGHGDIVLFLLSKKASTTIKTNAGKQALDLAREKGHRDIAAILEKYPYDVPVMNIDDCAAKMCAVYMTDAAAKMLYKKDNIAADLAGLWVQISLQYPSLKEALVSCFPEKSDEERSAIGLKVFLYLEGTPYIKGRAKNAIKDDFIKALKASDPSLRPPAQAKVVELLYELHQKKCHLEK